MYTMKETVRCCFKHRLNVLSDPETPGEGLLAEVWFSGIPMEKQSDDGAWSIPKLPPLAM